MINLRASSFILTATLILAPGLPAYAQVARGAASVPAGTVGAWGASVGALATEVQVAPSLGAGEPGLNSILGRIRLELSLKPQSQEALSFVAQLPPQAATPELFDALPVEEQVKLAHAAIAAVSDGLEKRATAIITRTYEGELTKEDRAELVSVASHWFYLSPGVAAAVKSAAAAERGRAASGLAGKIAGLLGSKAKPEGPNDAAYMEVLQIFNGASALTENADAGTKRLVPGLLAPYVIRALDEAEVRARERGAADGTVAKAVIENHVNLFGHADKSLFKTLRSRAEWTEFVSAMSLHAAERLGAMGEEGRNILAKAAEGDDLRIAIPDWHPLFGRYASISEWLTDAHGKPDDSKDLKGTRLFTAFGIPVMAARSLWPALLLGGWQFMGMMHGTLLVGIATAVILYASVLGHELAHALAARAFGIRTRKIILNIMGGGAEVVRGFRQALPEFVIALAGPIASALIGVAMLALVGPLHGTLLAPMMLAAGKLNLTLALFNMFPLFPMDGARTLRAMLTRVFGSYWATRLTAVVSGALSLLVIVKGMSLFLLGGSAISGLIIAAIGVFFFKLSKAMGVHPGTTTVDDRPGRKS